MFVDFGQLVLLVQNEDFCVATGKTDGEFVIVRKVPIHDVISAGDRDFDWSVEIYKHRCWQMPAPVVEMLRGKDFTDEKYFGDAIEFEFGEQVEISDVHHDRGH